MRHIISVLIENEAGALSRVAGLFSARSYNIVSLTVAPTEDETLSRMTIVTTGDDNVVEQITKQLNKLVDVVRVIDMTGHDHVEREVMLCKFAINGNDDKEEIKKIIKNIKSHILDEGETTCTVEFLGTVNDHDAFLSELDGITVLEVVRSGATGIICGEKTLTL